MPTKEQPNKLKTTKHSPSCPCCMGKNIYGMSRVVGYYSIIENWNDSKKAELADRQKGSYKLGNTFEPKVSVNLTQQQNQIVKVIAN